MAFLHTLKENPKQNTGVTSILSQDFHTVHVVPHMHLPVTEAKIMFQIVLRDLLFLVSDVPLLWQLQ